MTELISGRLTPLVKKVAQIFFNTPHISRISVKNAKSETTCPHCGYFSEYDVDINKLAELSLERMK
jgi:hypothetical protein